METDSVAYIKNAISRFHRSEAGAVTVDWVVLTSAIVGLGIAVMLVISSGTTEFAETINNDLENDVYDAVKAATEQN